MRLGHYRMPKVFHLLTMTIRCIHPWCRISVPIPSKKRGNVVGAAQPPPTTS